MPQRPPSRPRSQRQPAEAATVRLGPQNQPEQKENKQPDLTVTKVVATGAAAATSAVFGSLFGSAGTVTGAALGSVISTVATVAYQRSLERTRETVKSKIAVLNRGGGRNIGVPFPRTPADERTRVLRAEVPTQRVPTEGKAAEVAAAGAPTEVMRAVPGGRPVQPARSRRRTWVLGIGLATVAFVLGLIVVTGVEIAKGSTLTGNQPGTSVGRVVTGNTAPGPATQHPDSAKNESPGVTSQSQAPSASKTPVPGPGTGTTIRPGRPDLSPGGSDGRSNPGDSGGSGSTDRTPGGTTFDDRTDGDSDGRTGADSRRDTGGSTPTPDVPIPDSGSTN